MGFGNPLTPAQLAAAIASTTLTVTGSVTTTPTTPNPGTDADELRILDQAGIDALTTADKANPFVIWNTTTSKPNYVVNGSVQVPAAAEAKSGAFELTGVVVPAAWGTYTSPAMGVTNVLASFINGSNAYGLSILATPDATRAQVGLIQGNAPVYALGLPTAATGSFLTYLNDSGGTAQGVYFRNFKTVAGALTWEWYCNAGAKTLGYLRTSWAGV